MLFSHGICHSAAAPSSSLRKRSNSTTERRIRGQPARGHVVQGVLTFGNRYLDFTQCEDNVQALAELADACEPAKFGKGTETVLDETYRKAGKMDPENFQTGLDVDACGLVDTVQTSLLPENSLRDFTADLYKLNVYGQSLYSGPIRV